MYVVRIELKSRSRDRVFENARTVVNQLEGMALESPDDDAVGLTFNREITGEEGSAEFVVSDEPALEDGDLPALPSEDWMPPRANYVARNVDNARVSGTPIVHFFRERPCFDSDGHWITADGTLRAISANQFDPAPECCAANSLRRLV